jgi:hypothetical protein
MPENNGGEGSPDRLQPREDPSSMLPADAIHWREVYEELVQFKKTLTAAMEKLGKPLGPDAQAEVSRDLKALSDEADYLQRRLDFWLAREKELD